MRSPAEGQGTPPSVRGPRPRACHDAAVRDAHVVRAVRLAGAGAVVARDADATVPRLVPGGCTVAICTHRRPDALRRFVDSLAGQLMPAQLLVVDASPDDATERMLAGHATLDRLAGVTDYIRVDGSLRGLTRQRNVALEYVTSEMVAFFDDDVVLLPGALGVLVAALVSCGVEGERVAGVGAVIENELAPPNALWRVRRALGIVPSLRPGAYTSSGMSVPWRFMPRAPGAAAPSPAGLLEGDWLHGAAMVWRTAEARAVGFCETLEGYANGEDLEFSLRMRAYGPLAVAVNARVLHLPAAGGRPDQSEMGYQGARNLFHIHQSCQDGRGGWRTAYFLYAFAMDTLVRFAGLVRPGAVAARWAFVRGRLRFFRALAGGPRRVVVTPLAIVAGEGSAGRTHG